MSKTVYLWDMANTLFPEKWNESLTGFKNFDKYVASLGIDQDNPRQYESCFREPYSKGDMFNLNIADGYEEVLNWTKYNEIFSTGLPETNDWRAEYLNPKVGFDIRKYFQNNVSTFDFGETNVKTPEMLERYLIQKRDEGYTCVVYTDDKLSNCEFFRDAADKI